MFPSSFFTWIFLAFCASPAFSQYVATNAALDSALAARLKNIERTYGIQIHWYQQNKRNSKPLTVESYFYCDSITRPDFDRRDRLLYLFAEEWEKYPVEFVKKSGVKSIYFVTHLTVNGQPRFAMPDSQWMALYYDVRYATLSDEYLQHCLHHEFYHLVQYTHFGNYYFKDPTWSSFNPSEFSYGSGGGAAYNKPEFANQKHPIKGFVTGYATSGLEEDMAELFAYLMTRSEFTLLLKWKKDDVILSNKAAYLLSVIAKQCREMDLYFLNRLHSRVARAN